MSGMNNCSICRTPEKAEFVATASLQGRSANAIEAMSRRGDSPVSAMKRETIAKHLATCMFDRRFPTNPPTRLSAAISAKARLTPQADVATLVQQEVVRKLESGEARVTVQHGLQAQQLLDRREERKQDRALSITLARILFTQGPPLDMVEVREPLQIIEGTAREVS